MPKRSIPQSGTGQVRLTEWGFCRWLKDHGHEFPEWAEYVRYGKPFGPERFGFWFRVKKPGRFKQEFQKWAGARRG